MQITNLYKTYKSKKGVNVEALKDISFTIENNGLIFILGKSGSGKSTLLNLLGGLDRADAGAIEIDSEDITLYNEQSLNKFRGDKVGFVFQEYNLIEHFSVIQNIELSQEVIGQKIDNDRIDYVMNELEIFNLKNRYPYEISGGQRQRVAIARALLKNSSLILADEPTGSLDEQTGDDLIKLFKKISQDALVIVVTHDRDLAYKYGDRIIELADGKVKNDEFINRPIEINRSIVEVRKEFSFFSNMSIVKIGIKAFSKRKIKLIFSFLITCLMLIIFLLINSLNNFNANDAYIKSMYNKENYFFNISNAKEEEVLDVNDIQKIENKLNNFTKLYTYYIDSESSFSHLLGSVPNSIFYEIGGSSGFMPIRQEHLDELNFKLVNGRFPQDSNEILITKYIFEYFQASGYRDSFSNQIIQIKSYDDLIGKEIGSVYNITNGNGFVVAGIIDTKFDYDKYKELVDLPKNSSHPNGLDNYYMNMLNNYSPHTLYYTGPDFFENNQYDSINSIATILSKQYNKDLELIKIFNPNSKEYIHKNEIAISIFSLKDIIKKITPFLIIVSIIFISISLFLSLNYYSSIYSDESKTIKLLKSLGIKFNKLFLVLFSLPLLLTVLNIIISIGFSKYLGFVINKELTRTFFYDFPLLTIRIGSISLLIVVSLIVTFITVLQPLKVQIRKITN